MILRLLFERPWSERRAVTIKDVLGESFDLGPSDSGEIVTTDTAMRVAAVFACVRVIAATCGSLPLHVYRERNGVRERIELPNERHIWDQPNPEMTRTWFWETVFAHLVLTGNAYITPVYDRDGQIAEIWPIHPNRIRVWRTPQGEKLFEDVFSGTVFRNTPLRTELVHIAALSLDGVTGLNPIAYARETIGLALAAERYAARFFSQDARPGGIIKTSAQLTEEQARRLLLRWQQLHQGTNRAWRVAVLDAGAEWQQVGIAPEDAQFLEQRRFQRSEIAMLFGVPPHLIGDTDRSTSWGTGIEQQTIGFVQYTLRPWLVRVESAISRWLLPVRGHYARFAVEGLLRGDTDSRYKAYATARQWGWMSVNEIRALEDLPPIPGGDRYLEPTNMTAISVGTMQEGAANGSASGPGGNTATAE